MADGEADKILKAIDAMIAPVKAAMIKTCAMSEELAPYFAKLAKVYYDEYIKAGFTPEQALEMSKHGITMAQATAQASMVGGRQ
jgi:hypothetical protein